jgi:hypothetical protein
MKADEQLNGIDPSAARQQKTASRQESVTHTYKAIALDWLQRTSSARQWTKQHIERARRRLEVHFFPWLGRKSILTPRWFARVFS